MPTFREVYKGARWLVGHGWLHRLAHLPAMQQQLEDQSMRLGTLNKLREEAERDSAQWALARRAYIDAGDEMAQAIAGALAVPVPRSTDVIDVGNAIQTMRRLLIAGESPAR